LSYGFGLEKFYDFAEAIDGAALVIVLALVYLRFLLHLPATTQKLFVGATLLYAGGAIGGEPVAAYYEYRYCQESLVLSMIANIKEGLEMAGLLMFVHGLLVCIGAGEYAFARTLPARNG
jgi:hypothetical protein